MFVQIQEGYAAVRRALEPRTRKAPPKARYVRKPRTVRRDVTSAPPSYSGRHHRSEGMTPARKLTARLAAERRMREQAKHTARHRRPSGMRPAGVVLAVSRAHAVTRARRMVAAASRMSDLTGEIPRRVKYHGDNVRRAMRKNVELADGWLVWTLETP